MTVLGYSKSFGTCDALFLACSCQLMRPYNSLADHAKCRSLGYTLALIRIKPHALHLSLCSCTGPTPVHPVSSALVLPPVAPS